MPATKPTPPEPEPPHGALGELREDLPFKKTHRDVRVPKGQQSSEATKEKAKRSTRR